MSNIIVVDTNRVLVLRWRQRELGHQWLHSSPVCVLSFGPSNEKDADLASHHLPAHSSTTALRTDAIREVTPPVLNCTVQ